MFKRSIQVLGSINRNPRFWMSESLMGMKRQGQAKIAQKIKQALTPTYVRVDDISIGSSSCKYLISKVVRCTI